MMSERTVFSNNIAVVGWIFMFIWLGGLGLLSWVYLRDGGFHQFHPLVEVGIILTFWLFGLAGGAHFLAMPRVRVTISDDFVSIREARFWRVREEKLPVREVTLAPVVPDRDTEGDPYYRCVVVAPSGRKVTVGESHDKKAIEALHQRVSTALETRSA